jgi:hypothetical protein
MSAAYRSHDLRTDSPVAVKILAPHLLTRPDQAQLYLTIRSEGPLLPLAQASSDGLRCVQIESAYRYICWSNCGCKLLILARLAQW